MSYSMMCFDRIGKAKRTMKDGIDASNRYARYAIKEVAWYLKKYTTYTDKQILQRLKSVSADYFKGLPADYVDDVLSDIIEKVQHNETDTVIDEMEHTIQDPEEVDVTGDDRTITVYQKELDAIEAIGHHDTERLAFVFLICAKCVGKKYLYQCNSALKALAWRYDYDASAKLVLSLHKGRERVSGKESRKRLRKLATAGIVKFKAFANTKYRFDPAQPPAVSMFTVPIKCEDGPVAFEICDTDDDTLVLYYDRYKGYGGLASCTECERPILKTNNRKKYCERCAGIIKHSGKKTA